jgi:phosphoglycolate phosphatase
VGAYDLIVFDLDGTLIDSVGDIADALNRVLGTRHGDAEVARWVGSGVKQLLAGAGASGDLDALAKQYRAAYFAQPVARTSVYLGVKETLARLDAQKAIATNKPGALARTIVERLGLAEHFAAVLGEDDVGARKPDPLIVDLLRGKVGASRARTLYVGDSRVDAQTAAAARVDFCFVTYGYEHERQAAKYTIDRFADLAALTASAD